MNDYDIFMPLKPDQWHKRKLWIINRCLFLINLQDKNNERFFGGDPQPDDDLTKIPDGCFYFELKALQEFYRQYYNLAFSIWVDDWGTDKISYLEDSS